MTVQVSSFVLKYWKELKSKKKDYLFVALHASVPELVKCPMILQVECSCQVGKSHKVK